MVILKDTGQISIDLIKIDSNDEKAYCRTMQNNFMTMKPVDRQFHILISLAITEEIATSVILTLEFTNYGSLQTN